MTEMNIKHMKIEDLIPYENNPRNNDNAVEFVANSIKEFGWKQPIVIDKNNVIIAGHTRLKAAERLGLESVPCLLADDLTHEQVRAYRLADNKTSEISEWNFESLEGELNELKDIGMDMKDFGFDPILPSIDLDDVFVDYYNDQEGDDQHKDLLKWGNKSTPLNDTDTNFLNDMFEEHKNSGLEITFVEYLRTESL